MQTCVTEAFLIVGFVMNRIEPMLKHFVSEIVLFYFLLWPWINITKKDSDDGLINTHYLLNNYSTNIYWVLAICQALL